MSATKHRDEARLFVLLAILLQVLTCRVSAQANARQSVTSVAQLLAASNDPRADLDYVQVGHVLKGLSPSEHNSVYKQLVVAPHEGLAGMAARGLIESRDPESVGLIASRISGWRAQTQSSTLGSIAPVRGAFLDVPRELLRTTIKRGMPAEPADFQVQTVGVAAMLLAKTGIPADHQLLLDLASLGPKSWGVWLALAAAQAADLPRAKIASSIYQDASVSMAVRVAAASALESLDSQALAFAIAQVQAFLDQYSDQDEERLLVDAIQSRTPRTIGDGWVKYGAFLSKIPMLGALFVLQADSAQQITFKFLNARNQSIRNVCTLAAVVRWPDRWLKTGQGSFSDKAYADLLAIAASYHPELAGAIHGMITPARMATAQSRVAKMGLGTITPAGGIFIGF
jgi:hypothetical protein